MMLSGAGIKRNIYTLHRNNCQGKRRLQYVWLGWSLRPIKFWSEELHKTALSAFGPELVRSDPGVSAQAGVSAPPGPKTPV